MALIESLLDVGLRRAVGFSWLERFSHNLESAKCKGKDISITSAVREIGLFPGISFQIAHTVESHEEFVITMRKSPSHISDNPYGEKGSRGFK